MLSVGHIRGHACVKCHERKKKTTTTEMCSGLFKSQWKKKSMQIHSGGRGGWMKAHSKL